MTTIIGIWAHPDDEAFVSAGFLTDAARQGHRVVCIHMTLGEAGLSFRRACPPETLARIRESELETSLSHLGVEERRFFGYEDGRLGQVSAKEAIARIHDAFDELRPDVIVTFGPDGFTGHPDHKVLSAWVTAALRDWRSPQTVLYHAVIARAWSDSFVPALNEFDFFWPGHPDVSIQPDVTLRLSDELLAAKVEALRAHASQMKPLFDSYGDDFMRAVAATEHFHLVRDRHPLINARCRGETELAACDASAAA